MKDKITWEDARLFDYINEVEFLYVPDMDDYEYRINVEITNDTTESANKSILNDSSLNIPTCVDTGGNIL